MWMHMVANPMYLVLPMWMHTHEEAISAHPKIAPQIEIIANTKETHESLSKNTYFGARARATSVGTLAHVMISYENLIKTKGNAWKV